MNPTPRSYLFVPGHRPELFEKALASAADAVVVDLEDAVAADAKTSARNAVVRLLALTSHRERIIVRINDESTAWFDDDVAALSHAKASAVMLPKAERAATVERLVAGCPGTKVLALIESAKGVLAAEALAAAPGVQRLVFGTIDYALDLGLQGDLAMTVGLDLAASRLAIASRAAGIDAPVAGVTVAIDDEEALRIDLERARAHGFSAKLCIHPRQVATVHAALAPSQAELAWAERILAAASAAKGAAIKVDGRMVDKPVIERARRIARRASIPLAQ